MTKTNSNKANGSRFERVFAEILADKGFWVHLIQDNRNGQPFDVIACHNNQPYVFDCKVCSGSRFILSRMEENQILAMRRFLRTGNKNAYFAILINENIYVVHYTTLLDKYVSDEVSISEELLRDLSEEIICVQR